VDPSTRVQISALASYFLSGLPWGAFLKILNSTPGMSIAGACMGNLDDHGHHALLVPRQAQHLPLPFVEELRP
jgi:hypothetical protein